MRLVSRKTLRVFWQGGQPDSEIALREWAKKVEVSRWNTFAHVRATFRTADRVGTCVVFNVGRNRWRLVARINLQTHHVYVLKVMTHAEYDRVDWASECGCDRPWPSVRPGKSPPRTGD